MNKQTRKRLHRKLEKDLLHDFIKKSHDAMKKEFKRQVSKELNLEDKK